jgi:hypothetical protein
MIFGLELSFQFNIEDENLRLPYVYDPKDAYKNNCINYSRVLQIVRTNICVYNLQMNSLFLQHFSSGTGIIREPFEHFLSTLNYFRSRNIFGKIKAENPVLVYLQDPELIYK